jgi:hypothetical protein
VTYTPELKVPCKPPCAAFNPPETEKRRLNLPLGILLKKLPGSCSSGRGRFALGGGFSSVDGPGFDDEAGGGWLSVGPGVGGYVAVDDRSGEPKYPAVDD